MKKKISSHVYINTIISHFFFYSVIFIASPCLSQEKTLVLTLSDFLQLVNKNHPVAKQANLITIKAEANLTKARGAFDPELFLYYDAKNYSDKNYYQLLNGGLSWQTPYALKFKGAYQQAEGYYLNPQEYLPLDGLYSAGASLSLGKGLLMDEQRMALKQAKIFREASSTEQLIMLNQLYLRAMYSYLEWFTASNMLDIASEAYQLSQQRLNLVRGSFIGGDKPAIDTIEAYVTMQSRYQSLQQAKTDYLNASLELSNHLWDENELPIQNYSFFIAPKTNNFSQTGKQYADSLFNQNRMEYNSQPELILYNYKANLLSVEKRWKQEKLKPKVDLQYNFLSSEPYQYDWTSFGKNNYKWGAQIGFPLFLREGRGDLKLTKLKMKELQWEIQLKQQTVKNKINQYYNEYQNILFQMSQQKEIVANSKTLLEAEKINYENGEGSIFLINTRETNYLKAQEKYVELIAKYEKNILSFKAYMGLL